jgi:hypothetical protein
MIKHHRDSIIGSRIDDLKTEIASRDYQVIKAMRAGVDVDTLYPGHHAWYQKKMETLAELEDIKKVQDDAEARLNETNGGGGVN